VSLTGRDVDDVSQCLSGACFGGELIENPGRISSIVLGSYERVFFLKLVEQRLQLIDGCKTINDNLAFLFGAFD
jgi:hypothetical protein